MRNRPAILVAIAIGTFGVFYAASLIDRTLANVVGVGILVAVVARLFTLRW